MVEEFREALGGEGGIVAEGVEFEGGVGAEGGAEEGEEAGEHVRARLKGGQRV